MRTIWIHLICLLLTVLLVGCSDNQNLPTGGLNNDTDAEGNHASIDISENELIVQGQLDAYIAKDVDQFIKYYSADIKVYQHPNSLLFEGIDDFKARYAQLFDSQPDRQAELVNRISYGSTVIDHERITGTGGGSIDAIVLYKIRGGLIYEVWFLN